MGFSPLQLPTRISTAYSNPTRILLTTMMPGISLLFLVAPLEKNINNISTELNHEISSLAIHFICNPELAIPSLITECLYRNTVSEMPHNEAKVSEKEQSSIPFTISTWR